MENTNFKLINKENLIFNISKIKGKKICLMVKANAYGHGIKEVVKSANDYVWGYGVVNIDEAILVRKYTRKRIIIFAPTKDYELCRLNKIEFFIDSELGLKEAISNNCPNLIHLAINVGMNRYGTKSEIELKHINNLLIDNKIKLKSIYTHFPITDNNLKTCREYKNFLMLRNIISQNSPICFGGSNVRNYDFNFDILRLGIDAYGYGKDMKKVMKIVSKVVKINFVKKDEFVGYGKKYKERFGNYIAVVPIGYGDGLMRGLSNKFKVKINGVNYQVVGNICMDCFFVKVDKSVKVGDFVEVMFDADYLAKKIKTIPYEILTNFSLLRGKTLIEN